MHNLWAKSNPFKSLPAHMADVAVCAQVYLNMPSSRCQLELLSRNLNLTNEETISFVSYLFGLHDIGKATPAFQKKDISCYNSLCSVYGAELFEKEVPVQIRHEYCSASIMRRIWKEQGENRELINAYECILSMHHQKESVDTRHFRTINPQWNKFHNELHSMVCDISGFHGNLPKPEKMDAVCLLLASMLIICDWVASSEPFDALGDYSEVYAKQALEIARNTLKSYGICGDNKYPDVLSFSDLWPCIKNPRPLQQSVINADFSAALTIIEAPMGEGKTEAALYLAGKLCNRFDKRGIYMALPTQATSNQMHARVSSMLRHLNSSSVRLLHGTAFMFETPKVSNEDAADAERWLRPARLAMLGENAVGTVDQAMAAVLLQRFSMLRLLGLSNKVLIIDEIHAYDAYMTEIIVRLLEWCRELMIPVVLLSATLRENQKNRFISCYSNQNHSCSTEYPLITQINNNAINEIAFSSAISTEYIFTPLRYGTEISELATVAFDKVKNGGCLCILVNTVKRAQALYEEMSWRITAECNLQIFHAGFTVDDRAEKEKTCLNTYGRESERPKCSILIATQVVEQSLDVDFDFMITDLAPIDLLMQRAGRVHRHRERVRPIGAEKPVINVILPDADASDEIEKRYGASGYVYDPFLLNNTESLLSDATIVRVPADMRSIISKVYDSLTPENMEAWLKRQFSGQQDESIAESVLYARPSNDTFFCAESHPEYNVFETDDGFDSKLRASTRLCDQSYRVILCPDELTDKAKSGELNMEETRILFGRSISVRLPHLDHSNVEVVKKGKLRDCIILNGNGVYYVGNYQISYNSDIGIRVKEMKN